MDKTNLNKIQELIKENKSFKKKNEELIRKLLKESPKSAQLIRSVIKTFEICTDKECNNTPVERLKKLIKENQNLKGIYDCLKDIDISDGYNIKNAEEAIKFVRRNSDNVINKLTEIIKKELDKNFSKSHNVIVQNPIKRIVVESILSEIMIKNFPESFKISNLKDIKQQEFPKSFTVRGKRLIEIRRQIELLVKNNKKLIEVIEKQTENGKEVKITNSEPEDAIPVVLTTSDKKRFYNVMMQVLGAAGTDPKKLDEIIANTNPATTPDVSNVSMPTANKEYSLALPTNTKKFLIKLRATNSLLKVAYTVNESGSVYVTVPYGSSLNREGIKISTTLYFQSPSANQTAEIETWT